MLSNQHYDLLDELYFPKKYNDQLLMLNYIKIQQNANGNFIDCISETIYQNELMYIVITKLGLKNSTSV
jgi:disulfide oxidoreductase YuzD